ncbi:MAG: S8 family serine peptidase [Candidatus Sericytochromatia bacterium]
MKKHLLTLMTAALTLSACQNSPTLAPAAPVQPLTRMTAATQPVTRPSAVASAAPRSRTTPSLTNVRKVPTLNASTKPVSTIPTAAASSAPLTQLAPSGTALVSSPAGTAEVLLSSNYNTQTLIAGLRGSAGQADAQAIAQRHHLSVERYISSIRTVVYKTQGQAVPQLLEALRGEASLEYVEADQVATQKPNQEKAVTESFKIFDLAEVNDKYFSQQYSLPAMHVPEAWQIAKGADTIVAVIDTGVDIDHPDLKSRVLPGYDAYSQKAGPESGDVSSLNYLVSSYKHGSHVAGIIAAEANNTKGIAGVAPEAKILPIKIFPDLTDIISSIVAPGGDESQTIVSMLADAIVWAADHGANVINMSLAVNEQSATLDRAVAYALGKNVTVVVAAGNSRHEDNARNYLAAINGVIAVGATDDKDNVTFFSNSGDYVSIAAPGLDVISSVPSFLGINPYVKMSGTSMAAPNVAGVAALLHSKFGATATPAWIKQRLESSALDRGEAGRDDLYGHGLVNAYKALGGD